MKYYFSLILIAILATLLRFWDLDEFYYFIGDQGWYFLSAFDLLNGQIPLVGITASYTWLHQGAIWTYMLAPFLYLFNLNPIGGAILSSLLGVFSVIAIYYLGREMFASERIGLVAALILAVSPFVIHFSRMPYHISPMPLAIIILFFALIKYLKGKKWGLILAGFMLGLLYNLELATMVLWIVTALVVLKTRIIDFKLWILSFVAFLIPIIPMALYDFQEGSKFYHLTAFPRIIKLSLFNSSGFDLNVYIEILRKLVFYNQQLIFVANGLISLLLISISVMLLIYEIIKSGIKKIKNGNFLLLIWLGFITTGLLFSKHASEAYLPMIIPGIILLISYGFDWILSKNNNFKPFIYSIILLIVVFNIYFVFSTSFYLEALNAPTQKQRILAANKIINMANDNEIILKSLESIKFENHLKNYEYLIIWQGGKISENKKGSLFDIKEENGIIYINHLSK